MENKSINITCNSLLLFFLIFANPLVAQDPEVSLPNAWINEIHYDNTGDDIGEAIEVVVEVNFEGFDVEKLAIELYNGNDSKTYGTTYYFSEEALENEIGPFSIFTISPSDIQNGPDGIALSYDGHLIQFLSYEGSFTALDGVAQGIASMDIGVTESGTTPVGHSLQLAGAGDKYLAFTWREAATATFGNPNHGQNLALIDGPQPITDFKSLSIAPDKVSISWTKPIGVHGGDWDGVVVFGSDKGANNIDFAGWDYSKFGGGDNVFGEGTEIGESYAVTRQDTDNDFVVTITGLDPRVGSYHFVGYSGKTIANVDDHFSAPSNELMIKPQVANVSNSTATPLDEKVRLSWSNSMGKINDWWDEILIIASENPVTFVPDAAVYTPNAMFGDGDAPVSGEFVVYRGTDSVTFVSGLENNREYYFKAFVRYDLPDEFFWSSGIEIAAQPFDNKKYWTGGAGNSDFADGDNWQPAGTPGASHDVVLDNLIVQYPYEVLSVGNEEIHLNSLSIAPQNTEISIKFSSTTNNTAQLLLHDDTSPLKISNQGTFVNNITNSNGTVVLPNGKMLMTNEGKYVHNTGSGSKSVLDNIALDNGAIPGIIEFNSEGSVFISIAGRSFQELRFSSEESATYTSAPGTEPVTVKKALSINERCNLNLNNLSSSVYIEGDLKIDGSIVFGDDLIFSGAVAQNFSGGQEHPIQVSNVVIDKPNENLYLGADVEIKNKLLFINGNLETGDNKVLLDFSNGESPEIIGALENGKTVGNLEIVRNVTSEETTFEYAGISFSEGGEGLGAVTVVRNTTPNEEEGRESAVINRSWTIAPEQQPSAPRQVTFTWHADDENGLDPLNVQLWQESEEAGEWLPVGDSQDGSSRSITATVDHFSRFIVSDTDHPLPVTLLSFTVTPHPDFALLNWVTEEESDNAGFEIEKSVDGKHFYKVGFVNGAINSQARLNYEYKDFQFSQDSYYRLKQMDYDGKYDYSPIRFLSAPGSFVDLMIFPNPIDQELIIKTGNHLKDDNQIGFCYLINNLGQRIFAMNTGSLRSVENKLNTIMPDLQRGVYILSLSIDSEIKNFKLVKN